MVREDTPRSLRPLISIILPTKYVKTNGIFGIEIETEVESPDSYPAKYLDSKGHSCYSLSNSIYPLWSGSWKAAKDGSLRDFGVEFISLEPMSFKDTLLSIDEFKENTKDIDFIQDSANTSVHVHVNMMNFNTEQFLSFVVLYLLLEEILIEFAGECRRSNLYSLPVSIYKDHLNMIRDLLNYLMRANDEEPMENKNRRNELQCNCVKYTGLNIQSLFYLGSVEIRLLRGTTDCDLIKNWIRILYSMYIYAQNNPAEKIFEMFCCLDESEKNIKTVFGENPFTDVSDIEDRIKCSIFNVHSLLNEVR